MDIMGQWAISAIHTKLGSKFRVYHYVMSVQHKAFNETVESFTALEQRIQLQMFPNTGLELFSRERKAGQLWTRNSDCPIYTHGYTAGNCEEALLLIKCRCYSIPIVSVVRAGRIKQYNTVQHTDGA